MLDLTIRKTIDKNYPWCVMAVDKTRNFLKEGQYILHHEADFKTIEEAREYIEKVKKERGAKL